MKPLLLLPLLAIILVSGCTTGGPTGNGVVIDVFEPDFSDVFSGEQVTFNIRMKNMGSVDATKVSVDVLGLTWDPGVYSPSPCQREKLLAGQQQYGTSGQEMTCLYTAKAPEVPQGLPVTYNPTARVVYSYASNLVKTINIGNQEELKRIENGGGTLPAETVSTTSSPIAITVATKGPVRVFQSGVKFPLEITLSNVGGGTVCLDCKKSEDWNKLKISTYLGAQPVDDCTFTSQGLSLFKGQSNTIVCQVEINEIPSTGIKQQTVKVETEYQYMYDATAAVIVNSVPA